MQAMSEPQPAPPGVRMIDLYAVAQAANAAELQLCAELWIPLQRLIAAHLEDGAVFILPPDLFPLLTRIYDRPVIRGDVERPMVAIPGA
jgi:hypothetical protein